MFQKVLVANRGEIACRIFRTLRHLGCGCVAVYSEADADAPHVREADEAFLLGPAPAPASYLNTKAILDAARASGAEAIHPGYGFLSENAEFAEACEAAGIRFIGPTPGTIRAFGLKDAAKELAGSEGIPLVPGTGLLPDRDAAVRAAREIGYPVMLKSAAGGGGIGLQRCDSQAELEDRFEAVRRLSESNFGAASVFLEKFIVHARHVEVQLFGDGKGKVLVLGDRDCSAQRRNQKVVEEAPAPHLTAALREALASASARLAAAVRYRSAGTIEYILDAETGQFYFLEVNTRLQVEHGVTEMVTGIDLVELMVRTAAGEPLSLSQEQIETRGSAIEARIYAEDPNNGFQPSSGRIAHVAFPGNARCDHWLRNGTTVSTWYDPLLAKLMVHAPSRDEAVDSLREALAATRIDGIETNLAFLRTIAADTGFAEGTLTTRSLAEIPFEPRSFDVLRPGISTSIQDYPGREGYWNPGIPPSGPMDLYSFRLGNRILGNPEGAAGLEITFQGPRLRFNGPVRFCLSGAPCEATLDDTPVPLFAPIDAGPGAILEIGKVGSPGCRVYLLCSGGIDAPLQLGSRSTFLFGRIGGLANRALLTGDVLHVLPDDGSTPPPPLSPALFPAIEEEMTLGVVYGPHAAPDFFDPADIATLLHHSYEVHHNSDRTGVRLLGPRPRWARRDGGEAGLHPSNIHDTMYAIGGIDFTGDMPIILGVDGPSQGGFCCPFVVASSERWKIGQLTPGGRVRFRAVAPEWASRSLREQDARLRDPGAATRATLPLPPPDPAAIASDRFGAVPSSATTPEATYRLAGDGAMLVEYGPMRLDLTDRLRVQCLLEHLREHPVRGVTELCPAVRSLQVLFDPREIEASDLMRELMAMEKDLPEVHEQRIQSRIVHLPLSWKDPASQLAVEKYLQSVRDTAPWCPDNVEFIRRVNGLPDHQAVHDIVFGATYLVLGLGNVYLGAPCTTPLDPRHRLVTTKYNPARTWTPENAVGIGGSYLGIYGMEGPGGYQLVGRTCQIFNRERTTPEFPANHPWLLDPFDQVRFFPVSADELTGIRAAFPQGDYSLRIEETTFDAANYLAFLNEVRSETETFEESRRSAFREEREHWRRIGEFDTQKRIESRAVTAVEEPALLPDGVEPLDAPVHANVWRVLKRPGEPIRKGECAVILEAMKMEIEVPATTDGVVEAALVEPGDSVRPGQTLLLVTTR